MDNFIKWLSKPISTDDVTVWFNMNNMCTEKIELFSDFTLSLLFLIQKTYLGDFGDKTESTVILNDKEKLDHFNWCWGKVIKNFELEGVLFNVEGEHRDYFMSFCFQAFYNQNNEIVRESMNKFFTYIFNISSQYTKSDLDMLTEIYKKLDKNFNLVYIGG